MERATPAGTVVWTIIAAVLAVLVGSVELALIILVAGLVTALIITVRSKREAQAPAKTSHPTQVENPLRARLRSLPFMSGEEFEYYMADVFRSLGWSVRVLGGSGDQGVDLLVDDGGVLIAVQCKHHIAVQCKHHKRPVNNAAVQQVFAGAQHYRANQAWVVSPSGFTESAFDLARSTNVRLFD